ncbi:MAG TPA: pitrilysin family protein [Bacteroidales bacterium]|nr:pitrilysin family protein [Bacteroidales bacterium]
MEELLRIQPPVFPVGNPEMPEAEMFRLDNNVPVFFIEAGTEDVLRIEFTFHAGMVKEYLPLLASTTNMMLKEGSQKYTSEELNRILDFYGAFLHLSVDRDRAGIIIFCLSRHLEKILELSLEILFKPVFPEKELNALMRKRLQWFLINREKMQNVAIDKFFECIYGKRHPYGHMTVEHDFTGICPPLLNDFHGAFYTPENMAIIISGKIPSDAGPLINKYLGDLQPAHLKKDENKAILKSLLKKSVHLEKQGTVQTAIRIGKATINKRHPDYTGLKVVDCILGGYFGSRLMRNIREDKGYTYGIRSGVSSLDLSGYMVISTEVGNEHVQPALDEIYREIRTLQNEDVPADELEIVRNYMSGEMLRMFDGPFALAETFKSAWEFGLDNSYYLRLADRIRSITPGEIKSLANTYYRIDDLYQVTAGSK